MATDFEANVRTALETLASKLAAASELKIETRKVDQRDPDNRDKSSLVARTVISLDGDLEVIIPVSNTEAGVVVETSLLDLHQRNVQAAIDYRNTTLSALLDAIRRRSL